MSTNTEAKPEIDKIVTEERLLGTERRWRRFGEVTPAGKSLKDDGTPDYGIFGSGSGASHPSAPVQADRRGAPRH